MAKYEYDVEGTGSNADVRHLLKDGKPRGRGRNDPSAKTRSGDLLNGDNETLNPSDVVEPGRQDSEGSGS